jgi:hypothetical protein
VVSITTAGAHSFRVRIIATTQHARCHSLFAAPPPLHNSVTGDQWAINKKSAIEPVFNSFRTEHAFQLHHQNRAARAPSSAITPQLPPQAPGCPRGQPIAAPGPPLPSCGSNLIERTTPTLGIGHAPYAFFKQQSYITPIPTPAQRRAPRIPIPTLMPSYGGHGSTAGTRTRHGPPHASQMRAGAIAPPRQPTGGYLAAPPAAGGGCCQGGAARQGGGMVRRRLES